MQTIEMARLSTSQKLEDLVKMTAIRETTAMMLKAIWLVPNLTAHGELNQQGHCGSRACRRWGAKRPRLQMPAVGR